MLRVAWYRFRATLRDRLGGYLAVVLLIGLVGGVAMGAVAAARRTQSSFPAYLASTNPDDLNGGIAIFNPSLGISSGYNASFVAKIARLPHVKRTATLTIFNPEIVSLNLRHASGGDGIAPSYAHLPAGEQPATLGGSTDGQFSTTLDRPFLQHGRLADPTRVDEVVVTPGEARFAGLHIGSVVPIGVFTNAEAEMSSCCTAHGSLKYRRVNLKVVGIVVLNDAVVQDDVDALGAEFVLFTPAFDREFRKCCAYASETVIQLDHGSRDIPAVTAELARITAKGARTSGGSGGYADVVTKAERAIKPESIALGVFGAIAALAALLIGAQVIGRQIRGGADDRNVLRALGAGPAMTASDGLVGVVGAVVIGSLLAVGVAVGLSPLAPLGPARPVYPHPGIAFDWTVLGLGLIVLVGALSAIAVVIALRQAPHRVALRVERAAPRGSRLARLAARADMPTPAVTGIRFALEPGAGRTAVPVRSAILGAVLAVGVAIATVTFGASLTTLVSHPALYGWNWDYELLSGYGGQQDLPQHQTAKLLDHDRYVAASAGVYFSQLKIDGQLVPVIGASPKATVAPPLLSGHGFEAPDQIVVGASTLANLHKHLGDTVAVNNRFTTTAFASSALPRCRRSGLPAIGTRPWAKARSSRTSSSPRRCATRKAARSRDPTRFSSVSAGREPECRTSITATDQHDLAAFGGWCRWCEPGAAAGRDRQLPLPAEHPRVSRRGLGGRRGARAGAHAPRVGAATPARSRVAQDIGLHAASARRGGRVAVDGGRRYRGTGGCSRRHRGRPLTVGSVRPRDQRGSAANRSSRDRRVDRGWCARAREPGRGDPRTPSGSNSHGGTAARRVDPSASLCA